MPRCCQCWQEKPVGVGSENTDRPPKPRQAYAAGLPSWARRTYHAAAARALIHDDKLLIADAT